MCQVAAFQGHFNERFSEGKIYSHARLSWASRAAKLMHSIRHEWASLVVVRFETNIYSNFIIELLFAFRISCDVDSTPGPKNGFDRHRRASEQNKIVIIHQYVWEFVTKHRALLGLLLLRALRCFYHNLGERKYYAGKCDIFLRRRCSRGEMKIILNQKYIIGAGEGRGGSEAGLVGWITSCNFIFFTKKYKSQTSLEFSMRKKRVCSSSTRRRNIFVFLWHIFHSRDWIFMR